MSRTKKMLPVPDEGAIVLDFPFHRTASGRATLKGSAVPASRFCDLLERRLVPGTARVPRAETCMATHWSLAPGWCRCRQVSLGWGSPSLRTTHVAVVVGLGARDTRGPRGLAHCDSPNGTFRYVVCPAVRGRPKPRLLAVVWSLAILIRSRRAREMIQGGYIAAP
jgi:hypothetical protein